MNLIPQWQTSHGYLGGQFSTVTFSAIISGNAITQSSVFQEGYFETLFALVESTGSEKNGFQVRSLVSRLQRGELWGSPMCLDYGAFEGHFIWA